MDYQYKEEVSSQSGARRRRTSRFVGLSSYLGMERHPRYESTELDYRVRLLFQRIDS